MTNQSEETSVYRVVLRRVLASEDLANLPLYFEVRVLDRYRGAAGYSIIRTNTVGRLRKQGGTSLDFGIAPGEESIQVFAGDLLRLSAEERDDWAQHALTLPASKMMLQMRLQPSACHDDGEVRPWE